MPRKACKIHIGIDPKFNKFLRASSSSIYKQGRRIAKALHPRRFEFQPEPIFDSTEPVMNRNYRLRSNTAHGNLEDTRPNTPEVLPEHVSLDNIGSEQNLEQENTMQRMEEAIQRLGVSRSPTPLHGYNDAREPILGNQQPFRPRAQPIRERWTTNQNQPSILDQDQTQRVEPEGATFQAPSQHIAPAIHETGDQISHSSDMFAQANNRNTNRTTEEPTRRPNLAQTLLERNSAPIRRVYEQEDSGAVPRMGTRARRESQNTIVSSSRRSSMDWDAAGIELDQIVMPAIQVHNPYMIRLGHQCTELEERFNDIREYITLRPDWWTNYREDVDPLEERVMRLVDEIQEIDAVSPLAVRAARLEVDISKFNKELTRRARELSRDQAPNPNGGYQATETPRTHMQGQENPQQREVPSFTIFQDSNLEQNLENTRCFSRLSNTQVDFRSQIERNQSRIELHEGRYENLETRISQLEGASHQCDPNIYMRLTRLEEDVRALRNRQGYDDYDRDIGSLLRSRGAETLRANGFQTRIRNLEQIVQQISNRQNNRLNQNESDSNSNSLNAPRLNVQQPRSSQGPTLPPVGRDVAGSRISDQNTAEARTHGARDDGQEQPRQQQAGQDTPVQPQEAVSENYQERRQTSPGNNSSGLSGQSSTTYQDQMPPTLNEVHIRMEAESSWDLKNMRAHAQTILDQNVLLIDDQIERIKELHRTIRPWMETALEDLKKELHNYKKNPYHYWNDALLEEVKKTIEDSQAWIQTVQRKYSAMGCGARPLTGKNTDNIPPFDGKGDMSIYEFWFRFKANTQDQGTIKQRAHLAWNQYLSLDIQNATEGSKDNYEALERYTKEVYGKPRIVVGNIIKGIETDNLPTNADKDIGRLANHMRSMDAALTKIECQHQYGMNRSELESYLETGTCIETIEKGLPRHLGVELDGMLVTDGHSTHDRAGRDHYRMLRKLIRISAKRLERHTTSSTGQTSKGGSDQRRKRNDSIENVPATHAANGTPVIGETSQTSPGNQRRRIQTRISQEGHLNCHLSGMEHRDHLLIECQKFWYLSADMKRNVLNDRACWSCLGPREKCRPRCTGNPPIDMICGFCKSSNQRFIPSAPLCLVDSHRNETDSKKVVLALQDFFKDKFVAQHFDADKLMGKHGGM